MDMFAVDDDVTAWEQALPALTGAARLAVLVPLAWHLRQRDSVRAAALAGEALGLLPQCAPDAATQAPQRARLQLVQGEVDWLYGELDKAEALADAALAAFEPAGDRVGSADAHWLRAWIAVDRGAHARCDTELALAGAAARAAGDASRIDIADAAAARWAVLHNPHGAAQRWGARFADTAGAAAQTNPAGSTNHADRADRAEAADHAAAAGAALAPAVATWVNDYLGLAASQSRDLGAAAGYYIRCYEAALATGQLRAAITAATNTGGYFARLNDHQAALEWLQGALDLARGTAWPRSIGTCLMHTADTMRRLGRLADAEDMLQESLLKLASVAGGRSYAIALHYLGDLKLDVGDYAAALDAFVRLGRRAAQLEHADFQSTARRGQAHALSYLERPEEALHCAEDAVAQAAAQGHVYNQIAAMRVLAMIHARHALPAPPRMTELNAALHYLQQAVALGGSIHGYILPGDLLDALARHYAEAGRYAQAYEIALEASAAREQTHGAEATNRAIAMQVHHQTARARAEGLHHRQLAAAEARRAEVLQQTSATLERLSAIGQEITTHLDAAAVFQALDRHVHALLPVTTFGIYLTDTAGAKLMRAIGVEEGRALPLNSIALNDPRSYAVRCLVERRELYVEAVPSDHPPLPGTLANLSVLYVPLVVGERTLGVMTVQARHASAYGERERLIFRTLCAYGAIALDNAHAYRQLKDAQTQLVSQEKLAALGSLMAGVAHELNTPIGNSLLIASTMQEKAAAIERQLNGAGLRRSELVAYFADTAKASELVLRGLHNAADLVNSFKQVAVDRTTEQRRAFNLQQVAYEILATMMNRIRAGKHRIEVEIDPALVMDSYPGPLGQVISNLINNALLHAFDGRDGGHLWLAAAPRGAGHVAISLRDDGRGIAAEHRPRIFDPFFTTKLGQGGSGLGLSISYNIVNSLLGGRIEVASGAGGSTFTLELPLVAPQHDPARPATIY